MADPQPESPLWWLAKLQSRLAERQVRMKRWDDYYTGEHPLPLLRDNKLRQDFYRLLKISKSNFCEVVIDSVEERLNVEGFRVSAAAGTEVDERAWDIWQANQLDAESQIAHIEALVKERCPVTVWKTEDDPWPVIAVEDPLEMIVAYRPGSRRRVAAALKIWKDEWSGRRHADVWLDDAIYSFAATDTGIAATVTAATWKPWPSEEENRNPHGIGQVPVAELINRPRTNGAGRSDLEVVVPSQDRINKLLFDVMLTSEVGSFRQRWATGMDIPIDPDTNKPVQPFEPALDRLWMSENPDTEFGEFDATDLRPYIDKIEQDVEHIAVQTRTPRHYLIQQGQSPSGDAINSAEAGLVRKVIRRQRYFGEAWEQVMRLARRFEGEDLDAVDSETVWADPRTRTEAEAVDAATKKATIGVPQRQLWEDLGYSPTQIARFNGQTELTDTTSGT